MKHLINIWSIVCGEVIFLKLIGATCIASLSWWWVTSFIWIPLLLTGLLWLIASWAQRERRRRALRNL